MCVSLFVAGPTSLLPSPLAGRGRGWGVMWPAFASTRNLLDAGDQFVDGLVHRHLLAHHPVHRLGPGILVVQDGELVVLDEIERLRAAHELVIDRLAMTIRLPERTLLPCDRDRKPAAQRTFDVGAEVFFLQQEFD